MVTAKKHGRNGTRYTSAEHRCSFTFWPCGKGYASILHRDGIAPLRSFHPNYADAVHSAGEWVDPHQNDRYILDNDNNHIRAQAA